MYSCCKQVGFTPQNKCLNVCIVKSDDDPVKGLVFSVDPRTKLPRNDMAVYMSKETSPEVRKYIENMLFNEQQSIERSSDVDEKTLLDTIPENGETVLQYEKRMTKLLSDEKDLIEHDKLKSKRIERLKKQGFSDDEISDIMS